MNGFLLIDKPAGISSFGVVARVRWLLSQAAGKKVKVGHAGTLDPFATGLMIIVVGEYCKRAAEFSKLDKTYVATMHLGQTSNTGDPEGERTDVSDRQPTEAEVSAALRKFTGTITQTPPSYSAIKVNGVRAYKLARAGKDVEVPKRTVVVRELIMQSYDYPELILEASVSSGTYIRTLAEDIGRELGTGAYTLQLRRSRVGEYTIADAMPLEDIKSAEQLVFLTK